ncbi:MAG: tol-pal system-associated acyl-CoA thioesterase [Candidatus Accumulibacter sp.]|jgi:acyl-CoA thioester hydrolase|nr:tol-pal system-associated acyl-CoA thioesterase [Accumulibacter sp.]
MKHAPNSRAFAFPVRVYYEDTDAGGVVYYANYLKFLERCRSEWLRSIGCEQAGLLRESGIAFVVRSVSLDYLKPARLDDLLTVSLAVEKITRSQVFFRQHIRRDGEDGETLASGAIQVVCARLVPEPIRIVSIPAAMRAQLEAIQ